jgi:hypothetical protein
VYVLAYKEVKEAKILAVYSGYDVLGLSEDASGVVPLYAVSAPFPWRDGIWRTLCGDDVGYNVGGMMRRMFGEDWQPAWRSG